MRCRSILGAIVVVSLVMSAPAAAQSPAAPPQGTEQPAASRGAAPARLDWDLPCPALSWPLFAMILDHQDELELSAAQVKGLERVCLDFTRDAIRRQAELAVASLDMVAMLRPDPTDPARPVDMPKAEATVREIERVEAELDIAQLRAIEAAKAQLSADQRSKLASVMAGDDPPGAELSPAAAPGSSGTRAVAPGGPPYRPFVGVKPPYWWYPFYGYSFYGYAVPPVILEPAPSYEVPPPDTYWYYCPSSGAYYPSVEACDQAWEVVPSWTQ